MKTLISMMFIALSTVSANDIFEYHEDFRFLLTHTETLSDITLTIDQITPTLNSEVELVAAVDIRASTELLHTSTSMLLQQHAALVDVFTKTEYFKDKHIAPSLELLLRNTVSVRRKCEKYVQVIKNQLLFQEILAVQDIVRDIEANLYKYAPEIAEPQVEAGTAVIHEEEKE